MIPWTTAIPMSCAENKKQMTNVSVTRARARARYSNRIISAPKAIPSIYHPNTRYEQSTGSVTLRSTNARGRHCAVLWTARTFCGLGPQIRPARNERFRPSIPAHRTRRFSLRIFHNYATNLNPTSPITIFQGFSPDLRCNETGLNPCATTAYSKLHFALVRKLGFLSFARHARVRTSVYESTNAIARSRRCVFFFFFFEAMENVDFFF